MASIAVSGNRYLHTGGNTPCVEAEHEGERLILDGGTGLRSLGESLGWLSGIIWFALKTSMFLFMFVWIRATLPRLRYDQLMSFGWKVLLPLATLNTLATAILVVAPL